VICHYGSSRMTGNPKASGTLLTGHTLSTEGLSAGNYRVVITATNEATQQKAYGSLNLHIINDAVSTDLGQPLTPARRTAADWPSTTTSGPFVQR
jgi:hypothetical protein